MRLATSRGSASPVTSRRPGLPATSPVAVPSAQGSTAPTRERLRALDVEWVADLLEA